MTTLAEQSARTLLRKTWKVNHPPCLPLYRPAPKRWIPEDWRNKVTVVK